MNLKVHKSKEQIQIFETLQGEGVHSGVPSFFIRLQGCSVNCFFCDEKPTWKYSPELSQELNIKDIIERFGRFPQRNKALGRESTREENRFLKEFTLF